jgi:hypothetical protein
VKEPIGHEGGKKNQGMIFFYKNVKAILVLKILKFEN